MANKSIGHLWDMGQTITTSFSLSTLFVPLLLLRMSTGQFNLSTDTRPIALSSFCSTHRCSVSSFMIFKISVWSSLIWQNWLKCPFQRRKSTDYRASLFPQVITLIPPYMSAPLGVPQSAGTVHCLPRLNQYAATLHWSDTLLLGALNLIKNLHRGLN